MEPGKLESGLDSERKHTNPSGHEHESILVWEDYCWPKFIREVKYQVMFNTERLFTYIFCLMNSMFGWLRNREERWICLLILTLKL